MDTLYSCTSVPSTVHAAKVPALSSTANNTCSSSRELELVTSIHLHHHHHPLNLKYPNLPLINSNHLISSSISHNPKKNHRVSVSSSSSTATANPNLPTTAAAPTAASVYRRAATGYAAALVDVSQCSGSLPQVQRDMRMLSLVLRDQQVQGILSNPDDLNGKGLEMMKEFGKKLKFHKHSMALLKLLIQKKKKVELIGEVVDEFRRIYSQMLISLSIPLPLHHQAADMI